MYQKLLCVKWYRWYSGDMKKTLLLIVLQLASNGADAYFTNRSIHTAYHYETDPLARPFTRNTTWLVSSNLLATAGTLYIERKLQKKHAAISDSIALADIAGHTYGAAYTASHLQWCRGFKCPLRPQ